MAIVKTFVWGHTSRPWGYEIRVDFTDDATGIHNEVLTFSKEPQIAELEVAIASLSTQVAARIALEAVSPLAPSPSMEELLARVAKLEADKIVLTKEVATLMGAPKAVR